MYNNIILYVYVYVLLYNLAVVFLVSFEIFTFFLIQILHICTCPDVVVKKK
jgi:hypothetical protein